MAELSNPLKPNPVEDSIESLLNTIANKLATAIEEEDWDEVRRIESLCREGLPNG
jgi:hypothetical protein